MKYLSQRNGYYWLRIKPKKALLPYLPIETKEYLFSLGNVSLVEAERKAHPILTRWLEEIELAKKLAAKNAPADDDEHVSEIFSSATITEAMADTVNAWRDSAFGAGANNPNKPSEEFLVRSEMTAGTGRAVLPLFHLAEYEHSLRHLKSKTVSQRVSRIKTQFLPQITYLTAESLRTVKLQQWVDSYINIDEAPSYKTLKGYFQAARDYISWLRRKGYLNIEDTFDAVKLPTERQLSPQIDRESFSDSELERILEATKQKELSVLILFAMYTGCRIEELVSLKLGDIHSKKERYIINIIEGKNENSIRSIPVYKEIEPILVERLTASETYIFPHGSNNANGTRSDAYSKQFGRIKTKLGFGKEKVFHSIRKTVATKLEQAKVTEGIAADILGHNKETMTYGLYSSGSALEAKIDAIDRIHYEG